MHKVKSHNKITFKHLDFDFVNVSVLRDIKSAFNSVGASLENMYAFSEDLQRGKFVTLAWRRKLKSCYDNRRNTGARLTALA